jgi:hypothetical protein
MENESRRNRDVWAVVILFFAIVLVLGLASYHPSDRPPYATAGTMRALYGLVGYQLANFLRQSLGLAAFLVPLFLLLVSYRLFRDLLGLTVEWFAGYALFILVSVPVFLSVFIEADEVWDAGGVIGGFIKGALLMPFFGRIGAGLVSISMVVLGLMFAGRISIRDIYLLCKKITARLAVGYQSGLPPPITQIHNIPGTNSLENGHSPKPVQQKFDFMDENPK